MAQILDDPSIVKPIFDQLKINFKTGTTRSAAFRKNALSQLLRGYKQLKSQFDQALEKDLKLSSFMSQVSTHGITNDEIKHLKDNFQQWMKPKSVSTPISLGLASSQLKQEPLGVVLVISAWNYPIYTALPQVAAGISAGNCVILKPSQIASYSSKALRKLFQNYLDQRFYRCIQGKIQVAKATTKLPLDLICFTGSTFTGRLVAMQAAKNLTPCLLQLGGKCPIIVDESAKIQSAALRIIQGKYLNCGQTCIGVDHVYIHESIYKNFRKVLLQKMQQSYGNQQLQNNPDYSRIISQLRVNRLEQLMNDNHEGQVIYGGQINKKDKYISPTIIESPKKQSLMMQEQIFGPIMPIFSYTKLDDVIQQIVQRPKPLVVYLFSENKQNIKKVQQNTFSGSFVVNDTLMQMSNAHLPFGGVGMSGSGRFHGQSGFINFSNPKSICLTKAFNPYPMSARFPPYTEKNKKLLLSLLKNSSLTYDKIGKTILTIFILCILSLVIGLVVIPKALQG